MKYYDPFNCLFFTWLWFLYWIICHATSESTGTNYYLFDSLCCSYQFCLRHTSNAQTKIPLFHIQCSSPVLHSQDHWSLKTRPPFLGTPFVRGKPSWGSRCLDRELVPLIRPPRLPLGSRSQVIYPFSRGLGSCTVDIGYHSDPSPYIHYHTLRRTHMPQDSTPLKPTLPNLPMPSNEIVTKPRKLQHETKW